MSERTARIIPWIAGALLAGFVLVVAVAGNLEPPGPPAPTMKTLSEVEPCIPIHASDLPLTISTPGSYCLAENISTAGGGITISANNVAIDLRGFTLAGGTGDGISAPGSEIQIKNGTISGWADTGIRLTSGAISNVQAVANNDGINIGSGVVEGCIANGNHSYGIRTNGGCIISRCFASGNNVGFLGTNGTTVMDSAAHGNTDGCVVEGGGTISRCRARSNLGFGFVVNGSHIFDSEAAANSSGIRSLGSSFLLHNSTIFNTVAGIYVDNSGGTTVDGNHAFRNDRGIYVLSPGNIIVRNTASGNTTTNYDIVAGNDAGPIGLAATSMSPWANIALP